MRIQEADDKTVTTNESAQTTADSRSLVRAKRRGWRLQFGLRTLLVAMLVLGVGGGVLIPWMARAKRQREIVSRLRSFAAKIRYDNGVVMGYQTSSATDSPFFWQQIDFWHNVVAVEDVSYFSLSIKLVAELPDLETLTIELPPILEDPPAPFPQLACRKQLEHLKIADFQPGDADAIAELEALTTLEVTVYDASTREFVALDRLERMTSLYVEGSIADEIFASWQHITKLETLSIQHITRLEEPANANRSRVSGKTLAALIRRNSALRTVTLPPVDGTLEICEALADCPALTKLLLGDSDLTDEGLAKLRGLTQLAVLSVANTQVDGSAFDGDGGFSGLDHLRADGSQIGDRGAELVAKLPQLRLLNLSNTKVTDAGCAHLGQSSLVKLNLNYNKVTDLGASALRGELIEELYLKETDVSPRPFASPSRWPRLNLLVLDEPAEDETELEKLPKR